MQRIFMAMVLLAAALTASAQEAAGQAVLALEDQWTDALVKADTGFLERLYTDDIVYVHTNGTVNTKSQVIEGMKSGKAKYLSVERSDVKVQDYGDTQIVTFRAVIKVNTVTLPSRMIHVFVRRNGTWRMAAYQSTRLTD
jgi:ketosteroid isomerase-like protein